MGMKWHWKHRISSVPMMESQMEHEIEMTWKLGLQRILGWHGSNSVGFRALKPKPSLGFKVGNGKEHGIENGQLHRN